MEKGIIMDYNKIPFKNADIDFIGKKKRIRDMRGDEYVNMPNGEVSSHLMSSRGKEAFPTIFPNKPGSHTDMPNTSEAYAEAKRRGEVVKFATEKRAEKMAFGAWKKGAARKEAMQNYDNYKKSQRSR